jgi:aryl-alcohol dehydrogenase-like predicted oxidoreductase
VPKINPDVLQSWAHILDDKFVRDGSPVRRLLQERGMSFVAFSPLAQGKLLGKYSSKHPPQFEPGDHRRNSKKFSKEELERIEPMMEKLKARFGASPAELARAALQYLLAIPEVACVIPGFRNRAQVEMNLAGAGRPLTPEEVRFIRSLFA